jgi:CARDB
MPSQDRRAAGRRRAWGRGPVILKLESLERRELLAASTLPELVNASLTTPNTVSDWGDTVGIDGQIKNQGGSTTTAPFQVAIYASPARGIDKYSVEIGEVTIPAGLGAGQYVPFSDSVQLPATPLPDVSSQGGTVYITTIVNPTKSVIESNYRNSEDLGPPYDAVAVTIVPPKPANLVGTTLAVDDTTPTWGSQITVTAQVTNEGSGSSPQTRALLSLTPQGINYDDGSTVGIGSITVPPLAPYQSVNLVQTITLPTLEPTLVTNYTNFALTMTQDADYLTNILYPHVPSQGTGLDQAALTITYPATTSTTSTTVDGVTTTTTVPTPTPTAGPLPDLAASSLVVNKTNVDWGSTIQVSTDIQNVGQAAAGQFLVRFLLTGQAGSMDNSIYLGETTVDGLAAGADLPLTQTLTLPNVLPAGVTLNSVGYGRIMVIVDPEAFINESVRTNSDALSAPIILRLPGNATTVPTTQNSTALPSVTSLASEAQQAAKLAAAARRAARLQAKALSATKKLKRRVGRGEPGVVSAAVSVGTELTKLPSQAINAIKRSL